MTIDRKAIREALNDERWNFILLHVKDWLLGLLEELEEAEREAAHQRTLAEVRLADGHYAKGMEVGYNFERQRADAAEANLETWMQHSDEKSQLVARLQERVRELEVDLDAKCKSLEWYQTCHSEDRDRIAALEAENARLLGEATRSEGHYKQAYTKLALKEDREYALERKAAGLLGALRKYGRHLGPACWEPASVGTNYTPGQCHCGLDAALKETP